MAARILRWLDITVFLAFVAFVIVTGPRDVAWWSGLTVVACFTPFWIAARWQLGASFSVSAQAKHLVTSGLYSRFRHPVYVFGTPAVVGAIAALLGFEKALVIGVIVVGLEIVRARREERVLGRVFGSEYEAYRERTWF